MKKKMLLVLATGFGLGMSPFASGTCGALLGVGLVVAMGPLGLPWQILIAVALALLAVPICGGAEGVLGKKDDGRIVADEYLTFPLCMLGLPWQDALWLLPLAFVTNRVLDIIKPPPARQAQNLHGGVGIVLDDVFSSLYSLGINHLAFLLVCRYILAS